MGIDLNTAAFLRSEHKRGVSFGRTLCIGRQSLDMTPSQRRSFGLDVNINDSYSAAESLFRSFGADIIDSIDNSSYEGANVIHDLNQPFIPPNGEKWSCVFDGGSLEHVFHFPTAIKSCLEVTAIGGSFISITPWSGLAGHGFYQFSPELFYRILCEQNGFSLQRILFNHRHRWYEVQDPKQFGQRLELQSKVPVFLFVSARRVAEMPIFSQTPQQSDYSALWTSMKRTLYSYNAKHSRLSDIAKQILPKSVKDLRRRFLQRRALRSAIHEVSL